MVTTGMPAPQEIVDGVRRFPRSGLRVVVVGGGVGGLQAALECWRKGHEVQVLERSNGLSSIGDYFAVTPSGLSTFTKYPKMKAAYEEKIYDNRIYVMSGAGKKYFENDAEWRGVPHAADDLQVSFLKLRSKFAEMQYEQTQRLGIPVFFGRKIITYEEDVLSNEARVLCESGEVFAADIVIAADGIGSKSHGVVAGEDAVAYSTGYAIARVAFPREHIKAGSLAETLLPKINQRPEAHIYVGPNLHFILFLNHDYIGIAHTHIDHSNSSEESWHNTMTPDQVLETLGPDAKETWDPAVLDLISQIPKDKKVVDWRLSWRDPRPAWASPGGRIIQLGDAAHAFLPTSGNGATQALEDAFSLAECLRLGGKELAPWSTKVHQLLRYERVSMIQKTGFANRERLHHAYEDLESGGKAAIEKGQKTYYHQEDWMWNHKSEPYATENYWKALASLREGTTFQNTNLATGMKYEPWTVQGVLDEEKNKRAKEIGSEL